MASDEFNLDVDSVKLMRHYTAHVHIKREREMHIRTWIAIRLILLAAWIMNCNVEVAREPISKE